MAILIACTQLSLQMFSSFPPIELSKSPQSSWTVSGHFCRHRLVVTKTEQFWGLRREREWNEILGPRYSSLGTHSSVILDKLLTLLLRSLTHQMSFLRSKWEEAYKEFCPVLDAWWVFHKEYLPLSRILIFYSYLQPIDSCPFVLPILLLLLMLMHPKMFPGMRGPTERLECRWQP